MGPHHTLLAPWTPKFRPLTDFSPLGPQISTPSHTSSSHRPLTHFSPLGHPKFPPLIHFSPLRTSNFDDHNAPWTGTLRRAPSTGRKRVGAWAKPLQFIIKSESELKLKTE